MTTNLWSNNKILKIDHKMKVTQLFRDQLGLSQEMMAIYLAIPKLQQPKRLLRLYPQAIAKTML